MRALFVIVALAIGSASADPLLVYPRGTGSPGQTFAPVVLRAPLTTSGAPFDCGPNAVACVTWNGSALVDAKPNSWGMTGTVPQTAANVSPFVPGTAGAGPYTAGTNYYFLGTGNDVLDFAGDFSCRMLLKPTTCAGGTFPILFADGANFASGGPGYLVFVNDCANGTVIARFVDGTSNHDVTTANAIVVGGPNALSFGRGGTTGYVKLNFGATATVAAGTATPATAIIAQLGYSAAGQALQGQIYGFQCSTDTPSDALFTRDHLRALGMIGSFGEPLALTRSTTGTYVANGKLWTAPAGVARFDDGGFRTEPARTNTALRSEELGNVAWTATNLTVTADTTVTPDGNTTADTLTNNATNGQHKLTQGYTATAASWTLSAYCKAGTANFLALSLDNTNFSWCNCSTGAAGTNGAGNVLLANYAAPSGFFRCTVSRTMGAGAATMAVAVSEADNTISYAGTTKTVIAWGAQLEAGDHLSNYIPTAGTTVARAADAPSFDLAGYPGLDPAGCFSADVTVGNGVTALSRIIFANSGGGGGLYLPDNNFNSIGAYDGTTTTVAGSMPGYSNGTAHANANWTGSAKTATDSAGHSTTGAYDGSILDGATTVVIGGAGGGVAGTSMSVKNVVVGRGDPGACP